MNPEQISGLITAIGGLLSATLWPLLAGILVWRIGPVIVRKFVESEQVTLKGAGLEASFHQGQTAAAAALGAAANLKNDNPSTGESVNPKRIARDVAEAVPNAEAFKRLQSSSLLWVDDRPDNNRYERTALEAMGIQVELALGTDEAVKKFDHQSFDLVISDMDRPGDPRAAYTLLDILRQKSITTPFIIYAGSRLPAHVQEARERGALGCTNSPQELIVLVADALGSRPR